MAARQLNIRSNDAVERASRIAKSLGHTTTRVVEDALREYEAKTVPRDERGFTPEQRLRREAIDQIFAEARKHIRPDADWDDTWMYDENGLPR